MGTSADFLRSRTTEDVEDDSSGTTVTTTYNKLLLDVRSKDSAGRDKYPVVIGTDDDTALEIIVYAFKNPQVDGEVTTLEVKIENPGLWIVAKGSVDVTFSKIGEYDLTTSFLVQRTTTGRKGNLEMSYNIRE